MCMNVSTSCKGALPLSNFLEICLQKGSVLCMCLRVYILSSVKDGGVFTMSLVDAVVGSASSVLAVLYILLWVQVAGPSEIDVTNILIEAVGIAGVSLTSTNLERQPTALVEAPDIHSKLILSAASSRNHIFSLLLAFLPLRNFMKACGYCRQQCQIPVDSSSILPLYSKCHRLHVL